MALTIGAYLDVQRKQLVIEQEAQHEQQYLREVAPGQGEALAIVFNAGDGVLHHRVFDFCRLLFIFWPFIGRAFFVSVLFLFLDSNVIDMNVDAFLGLFIYCCGSCSFFDLALCLRLRILFGSYLQQPQLVHFVLLAF